MRSGDIWVEGSRSFRPLDERLIERAKFENFKKEGKLGLGVQGDGVTWLVEIQEMLDFNLKRLAHRPRNGKLEGARLEAGNLVVTPRASDTRCHSPVMTASFMSPAPKCAQVSAQSFPSRFCLRGLRP
ncbi:hypothetical protein [Martelella mediterranea]|uniref:hypothetical protein n=1 Tax=Martelella mediterranea TaxID=293089 RepID=UPI001E337D3E|nr:hypothetical protein [Martelella mediterranea]